MFRRSGLSGAVALAVAVAGTALLPPTTASAAVALRVAPVDPVVGEYLAFSGRLPTQYQRPVRLQFWSGSSWTVLTKGSTTRTGRFALSTRMRARTTKFRVVAIRTSRSGSLTTGVRYLTPRKPFTSLSVLPPIGQSKAGTVGLTPVTAAFYPKRAGRPVALQRRTGGSWVTVGRTTQNAAGRAFFLASVPAADGRPYRALAAAYRGAAAVSTPWKYPATWKRTFNDDFSGTALNAAKWSYRLVDRRFGLRQCSESSPQSVSVSNGQVHLLVKKMTAAEREKTAAQCPYGEFKNGMIGTAGKFAFKHGVLAARLRFPSSRGQHGSLFAQPSTTTVVPGNPAVSGAEIDVAEYFGDGRADGGFSNVVHWVDKDSAGNPVRASSGGVRDISRLLPAGDDWSDAFHVYSVEWTPTQYIFRVDGNETFRTTRGVSRTDEYLILSLLTSDWELPVLNVSRLNPMSVDWARVWQL